MVKIGFIQNHPLFGEINRNVKTINKLIKTSNEADLLVLPELCTTGYSFKSKKEVKKGGDLISEETEEYSDTIKSWFDVCHSTDTHLIAGIVEKAIEGNIPKYYITAVIIGPEGYIGKYRKQNLFGDENIYFNSGQINGQVFELKLNEELLRVGIIICVEWRDDSLINQLVVNNVDLICHPANSTTTASMEKMRNVAFSHNLYTITANRVGKENRTRPMTFIGSSQLNGPSGVLCKVRNEANYVDFADIQLE